MTSSLANHRCTLSYVFSTIFLFLTFFNIHIYFIILKTYDQQFTLTTKKSLHIIFKTTLSCEHSGHERSASNERVVYLSRVCRKLYWADVKLSKIFVSEMNGTLQYSVVIDGLSSPRAVVVHPLLG